MKGCGSCLLWVVVAVLLIISWSGASPTLRVAEVVSLAALGVLALAVRRRGRRKA